MARSRSTRSLDALLDGALDRTVLLGYSRVGSRLRRRWWPADPQPGSLQGRRYVVTGATSGLGTAAADGLLALGASVHVLGRNPGKVEATARSLREAHPHSEIVEEVCDVGDLAAVERWARGLRDRVPAVHGLLHNAGVMPPQRQESPQGHEMSLAVHVLGPHLMTSLLLDALRASGAASVVWMSSGGMYGARLHVDGRDDLQYAEGEYDGVQAYARTKRMQVVLADAWARAVGGDDLRIESMHPGWAATPGVTEHLPAFERVLRPLLRTPADGADTAVWLLATRPASRAGHFWHDRRQRPTTFGWERGHDPQDVRRLLAYVEEATGVGLAAAR
ncbi:SDR family NAD(P)-dependent oxidoreductase [Nocardioides sp. TRM66260-LWL]|uniref:SDR family NAD(P)-dependent oxidoreductase n=1 Tax=Nocardioides sp. TRM66260-LWL TaxID=2874478 RepID=UPI001CC57D5A|nr:SDR family NAD(P)-dependent oxidoreductase [Nocardioides sp. TRM66260-LWL]MBZ5735499.1 SDR family NAD(P)-dependent oxidoreductase [Nocardioides sp. TRM66260-LWL]